MPKRDACPLEGPTHHRKNKRARAPMPTTCKRQQNSVRLTRASQIIKYTPRPVLKTSERQKGTYPSPRAVKKEDDVTRWHLYCQCCSCSLVHGFHDYGFMGFVV
ncbi:hypothetical protein NDU88_004966 [Pleurodeles waltl]|uniref:Uncharacterized protein n=1 Tax=Pleurodeles waltl TaxID=8319 RepID=A0AAV7LJP5_PLEWA|nr:hypothetical protein NDU88_004966 [Pleurodeles waltl]